MEKVVIKKVQNYNLVAIEQALTTAFEELALENSFFNAGETVLIKPNLVEAVSVERAVTTHPEVLRALIRVLKPYKVKILVGDSPGYQSTLQVAKSAYSAEGIGKHSPRAVSGRLAGTLCGA